MFPKLQICSMEKKRCDLRGIKPKYDYSESSAAFLNIFVQEKRGESVVKKSPSFCNKMRS